MSITMPEPAPPHTTLDQTRHTADYPSAFMNIVDFGGGKSLDPTEAFIDEGIRRRGPDQQGPLALFNTHLRDGHFYALGCAVWAEEVARRVLLLLGLQGGAPADDQGKRMMSGAADGSGR